MRIVDRRLDWVAALAVASGAAVLVPSLAAFGMAIVAAMTAIV